MIDIHTLTIREARKKLTAKEITAVDLASAFIKEAEKKNGEINAYLEIFSNWKEQAEESQKKIDAGVDLPLLGIPFAMKDNILIEGQKASASSKMLENYVASYDATVTKKLRDAGAIFLGRTNMDEFAMGGSTENSAFGPTKNPHDTERVPGGSSGGSAAAVAMDGALVAMGTDTGGSIRQPASYCGLVGLKPTYGAVSRNGLIAMGSSLDQAGPLARTVEDAEIIFDVISGKDPLDSTSIEKDFYPKNNLHGTKPVIGIPRELLSIDGIDADVKENLEKTIEDLKAKGYETKEVSLPHIAYALSVYYVLMPAEVSSNLARFDGLRYGLHVDGKNLNEDYFKSRGAGFGKEVRRRIILGTYVLSAGYADEYYYKAKVMKALIADDFKKAYEEVDVIITPTSPISAFKIGEKVNDPVSMYLADVFTVTAYIVGIPAMSVPSGFLEREVKKLPVGVQLMSDFGREDILFTVGKEITVR